MLFDKNIIRMHQCAVSRERWTKEEFDTAKRSLKYILQVEAGEVPSNIKQLQRKWRWDSILFTFLSAIDLISLLKWITGANEGIRYFKTEHPLISLFFIFCIASITLYIGSNAVTKISATINLSERRRKAKQKLELLEQQIYDERKPFVLDYEGLALLGLDTKYNATYTKYIRTIDDVEGNKDA